MSRGQFKHPIKFIKIGYERDEMGSQIKVDGETICTKCRIYNNSRNQSNDNGEITYLSNKTIDINSYVDIKGYDECVLCDKRYRILSISQNEDYFTKTIGLEEINT